LGPFPAADGQLIPLPGLARRALAAPPDGAQQLPDPGLAIPNAKLRFNESPHATQRPQPQGISLRFRPGFQHADELLQLDGRELRRPAHASRSA